MIINDCLTLALLVCSLVSAQDSESAEPATDDSVATEAPSTAAIEPASEPVSELVSEPVSELSHEELSENKTMCWNGLGYCDLTCPASSSAKIEPLCETSGSCCTPNRIVVDIGSIDAIESDGDDAKCALSSCECQIKCLPPTTVYRGSYNECPHRHFCCIAANGQLKAM